MSNISYIEIEVFTNLNKISVQLIHIFPFHGLALTEISKNRPSRMWPGSVSQTIKIPVKNTAYIFIGYFLITYILKLQCIRETENKQYQGKCYLNS